MNGIDMPPILPFLFYQRLVLCLVARLVFLLDDIIANDCFLLSLPFLPSLPPILECLKLPFQLLLSPPIQNLVAIRLFSLLVISYLPLFLSAGTNNLPLLKLSSLSPSHRSLPAFRELPDIELSQYLRQ